MGNIPDWTGESMRNFFKQWKSKTLDQAIAKIWEEKKMRYCHSFKYPWYPFVSEEEDQKEQAAPVKSPEWKKGGRPWKPSHEKVKSKRKKLLDGEEEIKNEANGNEEEKSSKKRE